MDEAGRTTRPPLIMTPPDLETDPDGESADSIVDNGSMSSSRTRSGSSRSGAARRADSANGNSAGANGSSSSETAVTPADATDSATDTATPLPAETVGKTNGRPARTASADQADRSAAGDRAAANGDRKPVFTPATPAADTPAASPAAPAAPVSSPAAPAAPVTRSSSTYSDSSSYQGSSYSGAGSSYPGSSAAYPASGAGSAYSPAGGSPYPETAYPSSSGFSGSEWSGSPSATAEAPTATGPAAGSTPDTVERTSSGNAFSSVSGFSSGAVTAVSGAAAGFAGSVASVFSRRGDNRKQKPSAPPRRQSRRQAMLTLSRVEPWSVMKFSFVASVVAFIILFVAVAVLYWVLSALGVFESLQNQVTSITSSENSAGTNISHWFSASRILGYTAMLGALNIVLITAISTVGSVIYNLIAKTIGGIEVTLRETE